MFLRDFDFDSGTYIFSFSTHFHARWYQNFIHTEINMQFSAAGLSIHALLLPPAMNWIKIVAI